MKKRVLKIIALIAALVLIAGVLIFANGLMGNPISKWAANNTAQKYIRDKYSDKDFVIERVFYSFKDGNYHAFISSPSSVDSYFEVTTDMLGRFVYDSYESRVLSGQNTADRIGKAYREMVDAVLDSSSFPYHLDIGFGDIEFSPRDYIADPSVPDYSVVTEELELDAFYDVNEMGAESGHLILYVEDTTITCERMAEVMLDIRKIFDTAGVKFHAVDFVLCYPKMDDGTRKEGRVEVKDFLYEDIREEGMLERVTAGDEAVRAYYAEQDAKMKD